MLAFLAAEKWPRQSLRHLSLRHIGALIIRIGFWGVPLKGSLKGSIRATIRV